MIKDNVKQLSHITRCPIYETWVSFCDSCIRRKLNHSLEKYKSYIFSEVLPESLSEVMLFMVLERSLLFCALTGVASLFTMKAYAMNISSIIQKTLQTTRKIFMNYALSVKR